MAARNILLRNTKVGNECVITDMGLSRIFDLNKTYQKTKNATLPLRVFKQLLIIYLYQLKTLFERIKIQFTKKLAQPKKKITKKKWSAPELLEQLKYSFKSDIWSFGITCIEILTRNDPYPQMKALNVTKEEKKN